MISHLWNHLLSSTVPSHCNCSPSCWGSQSLWCRRESVEMRVRGVPWCKLWGVKMLNKECFWNTSLWMKGSLTPWRQPTASLWARRRSSEQTWRYIYIECAYYVNWWHVATCKISTFSNISRLWLFCKKKQGSRCDGPSLTSFDVIESVKRHRHGLTCFKLNVTEKSQSNLKSH